MGKTYTEVAIADTVAGKLLNVAEIRLQAIKKKYAKELNQKEKSAELTYVEGQLNTLFFLFTEAKNFLPLVDKGRHLGFFDYASLLALKNRIVKYPIFFYSPQNAFYLSLVPNLLAIFTQTLKDLKLKKITLENVEQVKTVFKTELRKHKNIFHELDKIPGSELDVLLVNFYTLIDDLDFINQPNSEQLIATLLGAYESQYLKDFYNKYEFKIHHPLMFEILTEVLVLLKDAPCSLEDLLPFLDPLGIQVSGYITYESKEAEQTPGSTYIYTIFGEKRNLSALYKQYLPTTPIILTKYIKQYFDSHSASRHVISERAKADLIQNYVSHATEQIKSEIDSFMDMSLKTLNAPLMESKDPAEKIEVIQVKINALNDFDAAITLLLDKLIHHKEAFLQRSTLVFSNELKKNRALFTKLEAYQAQEVDLSFCEASILDSVLIVENELTQTYTVEATPAFITKHYATLEDALINLNQQAYEKKVELQHELANSCINWHDVVISAHRKKNDELEKKLQALLKECHKPEKLINSERPADNDFDALLDWYQKQLDFSIQYEQQLALNYSVQEEVYNDLQLSLAKLATPLLLEYFAEIPTEINACYQTTRSLLEEIDLFITTQKSEQQKQVALINKTIEKLKEEKALASTLEAVNIESLNALIVEKTKKLHSLEEQSDKNSDELRDELADAQQDLDQTDMAIIQQVAQLETNFQDFNRLLEMAFELITLVEPDRTGISHQMSNANEAEIYIEYLDDLIQRYDRHLEEENIQLLFEVRQCTENHKDEIPFQKIKELSHLKQVAGDSTKALPFLLGLLGEGASFQQWDDFFHKQVQLKKTAYQHVVDRVAAFQQLLLAKTVQGKLDLKFTFDKNIAVYRSVKDELIALKFVIDNKSLELMQLYKDASFTAKKEHLTEQILSLNNQLNATLETETERERLKSELYFLRELVNLWQQSQYFYHEIDELYTYINGELIKEDLFAGQTVIHARINGLKENSTSCLDRLGQLIKKNDVNQSTYQSALNSIKKLFLDGEKKLSNFIVEYYLPLIRAVKVDVSALIERREELKKNYQVYLRKENLMIDSLKLIEESQALEYELRKINNNCEQLICEETKADLQEPLSSLEQTQTTVQSVQNRVSELLKLQILEQQKALDKQIDMMKLLLFGENEQWNAHNIEVLKTARQTLALIPQKTIALMLDDPRFVLLHSQISILQKNCQALEIELNRKQQEVDFVTKRIERRQQMTEALKKNIDVYLQNRTHQYVIKDMFIHKDKAAREVFLFNLKQELQQFGHSGDPERLLNYLNKEKGNFPGKNLQPILNRLTLAIKKHQQTVPDDYSLLSDKVEPLWEHKKAILTLYEIKKENENLYIYLAHLYKQINHLKKYAEKIAGKEGKLAWELASQLENRVDEFILKNKENSGFPNKEIIKQFQDDFRNCLHSQDDALNKHRSAWKPILANILLALVTLGVALGVKLLVSKISEKRASLFFSNTRRMQRVEAVDEAVQDLILEI